MDLMKDKLVGHIGQKYFDAASSAFKQFVSNEVVKEIL